MGTSENESGGAVEVEEVGEELLDAARAAVGEVMRVSDDVARGLGVKSERIEGVVGLVAGLTRSAEVWRGKAEELRGFLVDVARRLDGLGENLPEVPALVDKLAAEVEAWRGVGRLLAVRVEGIEEPEGEELVEVDCDPTDLSAVAARAIRLRAELLAVRAELAELSRPRGGTWFGVVGQPLSPSMVAALVELASAPPGRRFVRARTSTLGALGRRGLAGFCHGWKLTPLGRKVYEQLKAEREG